MDLGDKLEDEISFSSWRLNHSFEKYARQIGSFPQGSGREKEIFETTI